MKKLYIIDGSGYMYRAYYGLPEMWGPDNLNVNAIYGFSKMMLRLLEEQADYFVIAWDAPHRTIRHEMFEEYKANRSATPDDFKHQIPQIKELMKAIGVPSLELPGYEADDLIGTVATLAESDENVHTYIYSSDKDLKQMLSNTLTFKDPMKGVETTTKDFIAEYGFEPKLIIDYLALVGDASDNIAGVRGIGKKGAQKLIMEYGGLDQIYANIEQIKGATKQKLIDGKAAAYHSQKLVQLIDVPGIGSAPLDNYIAEINFDVMEKEMLEHYKFASMKKHIENLKKIVKIPQMVSLFG